MDGTDISFAVVLIAWFFLVLTVLILVIRYSNKKIIKRLVELKEQLKKIENAVKKVEKNGAAKKRELLKQVQSVEKELQKSIK